MNRTTLARIVFGLPIVFAIACGGSQKHAEEPDFTEKGWSGGSSDSSSAKGDQAIHAATGTSSDAVQAKSGAEQKIADTPAPTSAEKPQTSSAQEDAVVSGNALPPPPPGATSAASSSKPTKAKKTKTRRGKKTAKASG